MHVSIGRPKSKQPMSCLERSPAQVPIGRNGEGHLHCLAVDDWRFRLLCMVEMRRRMLPTPDLRLPTPSSLLACETRCGLGRGRVGVERACWATPAVNCISSRKVSRSEANLRSAMSNSWSLRPEPPSCTPLMVALLRLLAVCLASRPVMVPLDWRCSLKRFAEVRRLVSPLDRPSCEVGRIESVSRARSSSMVSSTGGCASGEVTMPLFWVRSS
jgi:hypothetical protein